MNENPGVFSFAPESKLMNFMDSVTNLVITNLTWLICCIPVVTAGAATKAMYSNVNCLLNDEPFGFMSFLRAMKKDFWRVTAVWMAILALSGVLVTDFILLNHLPVPGKPAVLGLMGSITVMMCLFLSMVFPMASQFSWSVKKLFVNGFILALGNFPRMIPVLALNLCPLALFFFATGFFLRTSVFWVVIGFALIALLNMRMLNRIFDRVRA